MLPLSGISRLRATLDADRRCPLADAAAAAWGYPAGTARLYRSSASHVFVLPGADTGPPRAYLRLRPAAVVARSDVDTVAALMGRLAGAGLDIVAPVRSSAGHLVETVDEGDMRMYATVVAAAAGDQVDVEHLTAERTRGWGAALARLHRDGTAATAGLTLPDGRERAAAALAGYARDVALAGSARDAALASAVAVLRRRLDRLPADPDRYGLAHGDFELDNLAWVGERATAFDLDEAERSWYAADIAFAVRDLLPDPRVLAGAMPAPLARFLAGYRQQRPQAVVDPADLAAFTALNAVRSLARLAPVLAEDPSAGADLLVARDGVRRPLREVLERHAERQRTIAVRAAALLS